MKILSESSVSSPWTPLVETLRNSASIGPPEALIKHDFSMFQNAPFEREIYFFSMGSRTFTSFFSSLSTSVDGLLFGRWTPDFERSPCTGVAQLLLPSCDEV